MSRLLYEKNVSLEELKLEVDALLGKGESEKKEWDFSQYGFTCHSQRGLIYFTLCTKREEGEDPDLRGVVSMADLSLVINSLWIRKEGYSILDKPPVILHLESVIGEKAVMKKSLGRWYIQILPKFSLFNNVFGLSLGYTDAVDNFEIYFMETEKEPQEYVSLPNLLDKLNANGFIRYKCGGCQTFSKKLNQCGGSCCGEVRYCGKECQTNAWKEHRKVCHRVCRK